jgi:two-component system sensor histidine kinase UhpB
MRTTDSNIMGKKFIAALALLLTCSCTLYAQHLVDSLVAELNKAKEDTNKVIVYRALAGTILNSDPPVAISYGKAGVRLGKKLRFEKGVAGCYLNISTAYSFNGQLDSALIYIDSSIVSSRIVGDPVRLALVYLNRGDYHMQLRNFKQSVKDCDSAWHFAELANSNDRRARILHTLGSIYYFQEKYKESGEYYEKAGKLYLDGGNKRMFGIVLNNMAALNSEAGNHDSAIVLYKRAIQLADETSDKVNLPMYYGNIGHIHFKKSQYKPAKEYVEKAMAYAVEQNNEKQIGIAHTLFAKIYLAENNFSKAIDEGLKSLALLKKLELLEEEHTITELLSEAYYKTNNPQLAYQFLSTSKQLSDSLAARKYDEDIANMQTAFQINEKNNEITVLNKNNELQQQRLSRQRLLLGGSLVLIVLAVIGILLLVNRNQLQQRIKEMKLRQSIAADLHDEVGSSISSIHMLSEIATGWNTMSAPQKEMLGKVADYSRETMDKMGDIVWMIKSNDQDALHLQERMENFLYALCNSKGIQGQIEVSDLGTSRLSMYQKRALYLVFKEAVNNALKYACPTKISVSLKQVHENIELNVTDNGKGFDPSSGKGNGLSNMKKRAEEMGGTTKIIAAPGEGTTILTSIPIKNIGARKKLAG